MSSNGAHRHTWRICGACVGSKSRVVCLPSTERVGQLEKIEQQVCFMASVTQRTPYVVDGGAPQCVRELLIEQEQVPQRASAKGLG